MAETINMGQPGKRWRFLAHRDGAKIELENEGVFDELVVDDWLHVEKMDNNAWWLRVGDARIFVTISAPERFSVDIERGFYAPINGTTQLV
jgi:hypothetical protein